MIGKATIQNSNVWKKTQFQCLEKPKYTIPMFEKSSNPEFQYLEKPRYLEKLKSRIPMFGNDIRIQNSNVWKSQSSEF